jgi:hypothetical protein
VGNEGCSVVRVQAGCVQCIALDSLQQLQVGSSKLGWSLPVVPLCMQMPVSAAYAAVCCAITATHSTATHVVCAAIQLVTVTHVVCAAVQLNTTMILTNNSLLCIGLMMLFVLTKESTQCKVSGSTRGRNHCTHAARHAPSFGHLHGMPAACC